MQLGIGTYTFTWSLGVAGYPAPSRPMSVRSLIELAEQSGIPLIQLADNIPLHNCGDAELAALRDFADKRSVLLEVGTRGTSPGNLRAYLGIAQVLGSPLLRTIITEPDLHKAEAEILSLLPELEQTGICLAIENHGLQTTRQLGDLFERLDHPLVGCCLDTVNSFSALDTPDRVIADLAPYVVNIHIKDFEINRIDHQMGFIITGMPAGSGRLDIPGILDAIRAAGKSPTCILELWTPFTESVDATAALEREWFKQSIAYLSSIDFTS